MIRVAAVALVAALSAGPLASASEPSVGSAERVAANSPEGQAIQAEIQSLTREIRSGYGRGVGRRNYTPGRWLSLATQAPPYTSYAQYGGGLQSERPYPFTSAAPSTHVPNAGYRALLRQQERALIARRAALQARLAPAS